ncbi:MAG: DUF4982 domain-containing protein [Ferruginibacter sp.]
MISIAHYWQQPNKWNNVVVYSNCDEVALYVNDKLIGKQNPVAGPKPDMATTWKQEATHLMLVMPII